MSLNGYSLKMAAEKLGIHRNTLTNYMGQELIPRVNLDGLVLVPELTMKNLLWMQSRGIPLTKYLFTDLPHEDGFKDLQHKKAEEAIYLNRQELNRLYGGRQNVKYGEPYFQEISRLQYRVESLRKHQDKILGNFSKPTNSGFGDSATMDPDTKYVQPEFLQLWGEPEEGAYKVEPFMYVGTPDDKSELLKELQDTIAEQEQKLETEYRRDKANNLKLFELKELLQGEVEKYMTLLKDCELLALENQMLRERLPVKEMTDIERGVAALQDQDAEALNNLLSMSDRVHPALVQEAKRLQKQRKSTPIDNKEQTNATPIDSIEYTKEENARMSKMLEERLREQHKPS